MALGIGGGAAMGVALEVTPGTYVAPTKFFPFNSETLTYQQETNFRRPIRRSVGIVGAVAGNAHVEGDIEMEALEDVLPWILSAARMTVVESGTTNLTYTCTPTANAIPAKTLSITIERVTGEVFAYVGCVVSSFTFTVDEGMLMFNFSVVGRDEATQSAPTPTFPTTVPFGAGQYIVEIPTGSTVTDADTFEFTVNDNAEPAFRLKNTGRGAEFIKYGERECTLNVERDFINKTDYNAFKALTAQAISITATKGTNNQIIITMPAAIKDTYEIPVPGQGELVRAQIEYQGIIDATGVEYGIVIKTQENLP